MLQRAASNAYSWWWASHIRTKQTKWLDTNLQEMEDTVKRMLKLIEPDADSFARRAELYFKRRPELITFVEDVYRAYRALAERYDHISGELHKANHTIATACPDQVQYAMLEEEDGSLPKAIAPIDPDKINKPVVEGLMKKKKKKRESESSAKKEEKESNAPLINKKEAEEQINKLQKEILVLQTEKEYIKSSYESGIAKYWEIEKQVMEKQEKVYYLQDEFSTSAVIEDNEARSLMTTAALKSCEDAIVNLQEQRKKSLEQAKVESERVKMANEKLNSLKGEHSGMENAEVSGENKQMSFTAEKMAEDANSLNKARLEIQSICEKVKTHFELNPESSVIEVAEKINGLVNKVITLELTVSSQATQINQLTSDNNELDKSLRKLEEEKNILINDSNALTKRLREAEEELRRVQAVLKLIQDEEIIFQENFTEACHSLNDISEKLQPLENYLPADAFAEADASSFNVQPQSVSQVKEVTEIHGSKEDFGEEFHTTQECLDDPSMTEVTSEPKCASENIEDSKKITEMGEKGSSEAGLEGEENILLAEYRSILQNYEETKRRLSETEKKNEEHLEGTMATITELKNAIAMKDEEIELLRQQLASRKTSSDGTVDMPSVEDTWVGHQKPESTSNSLIVTGNSKPLDSDKPRDLNVSTTKRKSCIEFPELQSSPEEGANLDSLNELRSTSPIEEKFRREIDTLLDGNLEFWLRFSTSFHHILEFKSKYNDLQAEISKLRDNNAAESNDSATSDQAGAPESASISKRLRELRTEFPVWLEQCELLGAELQSRISRLCELQEEISSAINSKSESAEILFTPFQAAKLHGEVMNMKQESIKAANELQVGVDQVRRLQPDIEKQLPKLYDNFKPSQSESSCPSPNSENSSDTTSIPLRVFLFGAKPKKRSFFERIQPVFQKQNAKLRASRWPKRHPQPKE